jgi:hypothetical protein
MLDFLGLLLGVFYEVLDVVVMAVGFQASLRRLFDGLVGDARTVSLFWSFAGQALLGLLAGAISLLLFPAPVFAPYPVRGASLLLAPAVSGLLLMLVGDFWYRWRKWQLALFTFRAGATFAFWMAVARLARC